MNAWAELGSHSSDARAELRRTIHAAEATIERCTSRMATCKPRSRFAYASQITKAKNKLRGAQRELDELGG